MKRFFTKGRFTKRSKGFTLIELLIVIAIMGVLAAVVVPNVGRFLGRGETEAANTELQNVQAATFAMMVDNGLSTLPTPVTVATDVMTAFPDTTAAIAKVDSAGVTCLATDGANWSLYGVDVICADASATTGAVNYVAIATTRCTYTADTAGTITRVGGPSGC